MKRKTLALALVALVIVVAGALSGCIRVDRFTDEGDRTTRNYDLTGFTKIEIGYAFDLEVIPSDNFSVTVTAGETFLDKLDVHLRGDTLVFTLHGWTFSFHETPGAVVTMPLLTGLDCSGATSTTALGFTTDGEFELDLSGASSVTMDLTAASFRAEISGASRARGDLVAGSTRVEVSGASSIDVNGTGGDLRLGASGASRAELRGYEVDDADLDLSGASTTYLNAAGRVDAEISGASHLTYVGAPTIGTLDISGGSSIKHEE